LTPFASLASALRETGLGDGASPDDRVLRADPVALAAWASNHASDRDVLLVVDQAEELVTMGPGPEDTEAYLRLLANALEGAAGRLRALFTVRSEFEPQFARLPLGPRWHAAKFLVPQMTQDELRRVIEGPAAARVIRFESAELVDKLVNEVVQMPGALPLLSFALSEMYRSFLKRRDDRTLTLQDYEALAGGVTGSLRVRADQVFDELDALEQETACRVLERLVSLQAGELTRRRVPRRELNQGEKDEDARVNRVLDRLVEARLLVTDELEGESYVELAHDALIHGWDRLFAWVRKDAPLILTLRRLTSGAEAWDPSRRETSDLLWNDPARLASIKALLVAVAPGLNRTEREFARASIRRAWRNRAVRTGAVCLLAAISVIATWSAYLARERQLLATSRQLAAEAAAAIDQSSRANGFSDDGLLKAAIAAHVKPTVEASRTLVQSLAALRYLRAHLHHHQAPIMATGIEPRGRWATTVDEQGAYAVWDLEGQARLRLSGMAQPPSGTWSAAAFDPEVGLLALGGEGGALLLCDLANPSRRCAKVRTRPAGISALALFRGDLLAAGDRGGGVTVFRQIDQTWTPWRILDGHKAPIYAIALDPTTGTLFTGDQSGEVRVWTMAAEHPREKTLPGHATAIWHLVVHPEGTRLFSADGTGQVMIWNFADDFQSAKPLEGQRGTILDLSISGPFLVVSDAGGNMNLWRIDGEQPVRNALTTLGSNVWKHAIVGSPGKLVGFDAVGNVMTWPLDGSPTRPKVLGKMDAPRKGFITTLSSDRSGRLLIAGDRSGRVQLWNFEQQPPLGNVDHIGLSDIRSAGLSAGAEVVVGASFHDVFVRSPHPGSVSSRNLADLGSITDVAVSGDGSRLAVANFSGELFSVDLRPEPPVVEKIGQFGTTVVGLGWSHDGTMLAGGRGDGSGTLTIWQASDNGPWNSLSLPGHESTVKVTAFVPGRDMLVSGADDGSLFFWDLAGRTDHPTDAKKLSQSVTALAVSADGTEVVSADLNGLVDAWELGEKGPTKRLEFRHEEYVTAVAIHPTRRYVAVADIDGRVFLRESTTGALLGELKPEVKVDAYSNSNKMYVEALAFNGTGKRLYGVFRDGRLTAWATSPTEWIAVACRLANRAPTAEEQALYRSPFDSEEACLR